jgi:hypothetical protein
MMDKMGRATDAMVVRLQRELEERSAAANGIIANAQDGERDGLWQRRREHFSIDGNERPVSE